ncbi:MAG: 2,3-bisphosphoglycerate-independent phosphoglycerate mutase, partial [Solirubrobacteraceae bacterium]|nr:2,3-bisphosphoglycerate-independent phosphoglycerate mutase [Solirubrobacteraceae bacterium]
APVDRGALEAAAHDIEVGPGERAWRVDVGGRPGAAAVARAAAALRLAAPRHAVHTVRGHRLVVVGPPPPPALPPPSGAGVCRVWGSWGTKPDTPPGLRAWPEGIVPPRLLDVRTVVVGARGAAIGAARLMGAATIVPDGATGDPGSDLAAKARAALQAIEAARLMGGATIVPDGATTGDPGSRLPAETRAALHAIEVAMARDGGRGEESDARVVVPGAAPGVRVGVEGAAPSVQVGVSGAASVRVVVHVGGADEAAHLRDRAAKVAVIERADAQLVAPLAAAIARAGGTLTVCPDHGCDPRTGAHDAAPVPCLTWSPARGRDRPAGPHHRRLTERAVRHLPVVELPSGRLGVAA